MPAVRRFSRSKASVIPVFRRGRRPLLARARSDSACCTVADCSIAPRLERSPEVSACWSVRESTSCDVAPLGTLPAKGARVVIVEFITSVLPGVDEGEVCCVTDTASPGTETPERGKGVGREGPVTCSDGVWPCAATAKMDAKANVRSAPGGTLWPGGGRVSFMGRTCSREGCDLPISASFCNRGSLSCVAGKDANRERSGLPSVLSRVWRHADK